MTTTTHAPMSDSRIPTDTTLVAIPTLLPVLDNAAYAWRNLSNPHPVLEQLPDDLVHDCLDDLYAAGTAAMALVLPEVWLEHGYVMESCTEQAMFVRERDIPDSVFHAVWDEAARRIDAEALVDAAGLTDEYRRGE